MNRLIIAVLMTASTLGVNASPDGRAPIVNPSIATSGSDAQTDIGYMLYRRAVLGDISVSTAPVAAATKPATRMQHGSYARYLMHNGTDEGRAVEQGRLIGETPTAAAPQAAELMLELDSYERYQATVLGRSESEIRREQAGRLVAQRAAAKKL